MRKCIKCNKEKELSEYNFANKALKKRRTVCRSCTKMYGRKHYRANKDKYIKTALQNNKIYLKKRKEKLETLKIKCKQCGENHPAVLEFHHRDPNKKEFTIGSYLHIGGSFKLIEEEIKKCDVLCSNCHKKLHWNERNVASLDQQAESMVSNTVQFRFESGERHQTYSCRVIKANEK